ncbi:glycosyltransferase [Elusimicrobiota bacterium]
MPTINVTIIIPAYNDENIIGSSIEKVISYFSSINYNYELIIIDDGSTDGTIDIIKTNMNRYPAIRLITNTKNCGKGFSVKKGIETAIGEFILFTDSDLQIHIDQFEYFLNHLKNDNQLIIASRLKKQSEVTGKQPFKRLIARLILHYLTKLILFNDIADPQCGFKLFPAKFAKDIFKKISIPGFGFDLELLYLWKKNSGEVIELPVKWHVNLSSKVSILRDGFRIFLDIFRIKLKYNKLPLTR